MKLYTEEQVKQIVEKSRETGLTADYLILTIPSIELPSDEEIEKEAEKYPYGGREGSKRKAFIEGVEWMRDKILNK